MRYRFTLRRSIATRTLKSDFRKLSMAFYSFHLDESMPHTTIDDEATLADALALIDEWGLEVHMGETTTLPESLVLKTVEENGLVDSDRLPPGTVSPTTKPTSTSVTHNQWYMGTKKLTAQQNRRNEVVYLRRTVRELEAQLIDLQGIGERTDLCMNTSIQMDAAVVWQQIASRQRQHRHESELENLRLRTQVDEQLKMAKNVLKMLVRARRNGDKEKMPMQSDVGDHGLWY